MQSKNTLCLTIKFASLQALITLVDKLPVHTTSLRLKNDFTTYLPYIISQGIIDCIRILKPDLQERKVITYTKSLSIGVGIITSAFVSVSYTGMDYLLNFTFTLVKSTVATIIIDKLNKLKTIDGVSVAVLLNLIFFLIPTIISGLSTQPLSIVLLFIASIGIIAYGNYKLLQNTEDVPVHYKNTNDKMCISTRNYYTTSLIMSQFITGLASTNPIIQGGLMFIINPLIHWFMSSSMNTEEMNKHLQQSNMFISGYKHGKETEDYIKRMIRYNSIKLGVIGATTFILSTLLVKVFAITISPITLAVAVNSFINISFSAKALIKSNLGIMILDNISKALTTRKLVVGGNFKALYTYDLSKSILMKNANNTYSILMNINDVEVNIVALDEAKTKEKLSIIGRQYDSNDTARVLNKLNVMAKDKVDTQENIDKTINNAINNLYNLLQGIGVDTTKINIERI